MLNLSQILAKLFSVSRKYTTSCSGGPSIMQGKTNWFVHKEVLSAHEIPDIYHSKTVNEKILNTSYIASYEFLKLSKPILLLITLGSLVCNSECMFNENTAKVIEAIPLSNDTISRKIGDFSENVDATIISLLFLLNIRVKWRN